MIKEVKSIEDANICDDLLTKLVLDERQYNNLIDNNFVVEDYFNKILNDDSIMLLAYYFGQKIVGYILIRKIDSNLCLLDGLYVLEEYRNQGIANGLLNEAINECKKMGVKYVDIKVMAKNDVAMRIYKKHDFVEYEINLRKEIQLVVFDQYINLT